LAVEATGSAMTRSTEIWLLSATADRRNAEELATALRSRGFKISMWSAIANVGSASLPTAEHQIASVDCVVVLVSNASAADVLVTYQVAFVLSMKERAPLLVQIIVGDGARSLLYGSLCVELPSRGQFALAADAISHALDRDVVRSLCALDVNAASQKRRDDERKSQTLLSRRDAQFVHSTALMALLSLSALLMWLFGVASVTEGRWAARLEYTTGVLSLVTGYFLARFCARFIGPWRFGQ
jgi:hypothetical protein